VGYLKIFLGPHGALVAETAAFGPMKYLVENGSLTEKLLDLSRYVFVGKAMVVGLVQFQGRIMTAMVSLYVLWSMLSKPRRSSLGRNIGTLGVQIVVLSLMLVGFFFVYVTTPMSLTWHVSTSLPRLLLQLWPGSVFVLFMVTSEARLGGVVLARSQVTAVADCA
jgi:hypothetical protein